MSRRPVRKGTTTKPVPSPLPRKAKAKAISRAAPKPVAAARTVPPAERSAPAAHVRTPPGPLAETLPPPAIARKALRTVSPKAPVPQTGMALHTATGARKYLTAGERDAFLRQADVADRPVRTLCMTLAYAGCRLSEALALTADRVDLAAGVLTIESLKKRRTGIYRAVPVPPALLETLDMVHGIRDAKSRRGKGHGERLWPWSRMTGWRAVHAVMEAAGLDGVHASPKGLRHGFGVAAVTAGIPLNLVQKWLGHAQLSTTAIYANAVGAEEKDIAQRMWA
jgi:integrase/recombinase XerD